MEKKKFEIHRDLLFLNVLPFSREKSFVILILQFCYFEMSFLISGQVQAEDKRTQHEEIMASSVFLDTTLQAVCDFRFSCENCDILLLTNGGVRFLSHKAILCSCSDYFRALFCGLLTEKYGGRPSKYILLCGTPLSTVATLLFFLYTGRLKVANVNEAESLLYLADQLIIPLAAKACEKFLTSRLEIQNCIHLHDITKKCYCPYLQQRVREFILQNLVHRIRYCNEHFFALSAEDLYSLLNDDNLNTRREEHVLRLIIDWIEDDEDCRKGYLSVLLKTVRLGLCRSRFLFGIMHTNDLIKGNSFVMNRLEHIAILLLDRKRYKMKIPRSEMYLFRHRNPSSMIVVIGGWMRSGITSRMDIFNPKTGKWISSVYNDSLNPRAYHGVVYSDRFIYCLGGFSGSRCLSTVRRFNIDRREWTSVASMHSARCYGAYAVATGPAVSTILAAGGYDGMKRCQKCELFDPSLNTWFTVAPMMEKRSDASAASCRDHFFVAGGYNGFRVLSSVEMYHPKEDYWCDVTPMLSPRSGFRLLNDNYDLLAVGGFNGSKRIRVVERFDTETGFWSVVTKMKEPRSNFAAVILEDSLYVMGGYHIGDTTERSMEMINLRFCRGPKRSYKSWSSLPSLKEERSALDACVVTQPGLASLIHDESAMDCS